MPIFLAITLAAQPAACLAAEEPDLVFVSQTAEARKSSSEDIASTEDTDSVMNQDLLLSEAADSEEDPEADTDPDGQKIVINLNEVDYEKLKEYFETGFALLTSPEMQELLHYVEVQELLKTVAASISRFANEDEELTKKILSTLGVEEQYLGLMVSALQWIDQLGQYLTEVADNEIVREIQDLLKAAGLDLNDLDLNELYLSTMDGDMEKLREVCFSLYMEICERAAAGELPVIVIS